ncbi:hypothetical protein Acr_11g0008150 [Actinidia rufa]|uniref:Uncharacterized protein n=1 Tax=Actinidia rufa TaxID=165716 RepID=A0A7J0FEB7_9ERIC|nr:hypothetical protein Acr_11g0008150 [Actinidia rufa]
MIDKVNRLPSSPGEDPPEVSPPWNDSSDYGEDPGMARIPTKGKTILSSRPSKVAFYEATFPVGLKFSVYPTIRRILNFYNICPAQLSLNAWRCVVCVLVIWQFLRRHLSLNEFRCLYTLFKKSKARLRVALLQGGEDEEGFKEDRARGYFYVLGVLDSRTFHRFFTPSRGKMSSSGGDKDASRDGLVAISGDESESLRPRDRPPQSETPQDELVEYLETIRKEWKRILPHLLDLTMLRPLGEKVPNPLGLGLFSSSSSSDSRLESLSDSGLSLELRSNAMSKRIGLAKFAKKVDGKKDNEVSKVDTSSNTGVIRDLVINDSKGKEASPPPKAKKPRPSRTASKGTTRLATPEEGSSKKPGEMNYGRRCFRDGKCLCDRENSCQVILREDKEKVVKLSLD